MADQTFDDPRLALNRIYTKRGDAGETGLAGGQRVPKDSLRIEAYGTVDELNSFVGLASVSCQEQCGQDPRMGLLAAILRRVQHELFNLGSILATMPEDVHPKQARITDAEIAQLEREIDAMNEDLAAAAQLRAAGRHAAQCRTARRAHRSAAARSGCWSRWRARMTFRRKPSNI